MLHKKIRNRVQVGDPWWHFEHASLHKSLGQKYFGDWVLVYSNNRGQGLLGPLWVEIVEVKAIDGVSEVGPVQFHQDICPLPEAIFDDIGPFPHGFELSCPQGLFCDIIVKD